MKYLGYIPLIFAFVVGYQSWHPGLIIGCAVVSAFIYMSYRRDQVKHKNYTGGTNMIVDGAYLITIQALIMFAAYLLGWLMVRQMPNILGWLHLG